MKHFFLMILAFWPIHIHPFSLFALYPLWFTPTTTVFAPGNETDHLALLKFKESISSDPYGILISWNSSTDFCKWHGVICNPMLQRVTELNLQGYKLAGSISPHVGNLSYVRNFNLANNDFYKKIPQELGRMSQLQNLFVGNNTLEGEIPTNLTGCIHLKSLILYGNNLTGKIPIEIASLQKLQNLHVAKNQLIGGIPSFIQNLSSLDYLSVAFNNLEGNIPQEICGLKRLTEFSFHINKLCGTFPSCFFNMSSLSYISATKNQFNGSFPPNMFHTLPNLQELYIGGNQISGSIPPSIINASILSTFDIRDNHFVGQVPSLMKLQDLQYLSFSKNNLGDNSTNDLEFLNSLTNCSKLQVLAIAYNNFGGHLPNSLGNLSTQLSRLYFTGNQISGEIPASIGNLISLTVFSIYYNCINGIIPTTFGKFQQMQVLGLTGNKLSGEMGTFIGNLSQLFCLEMGANMLEGSIPPSIGNCQMLQYLDLAHNNLRGTIPLEVFNLSSLTNWLALSQNSLSGSIPEEVGNLQHLDLLDFSENHLSGHILRAIGECVMLEYLYLQGNSLNGIIPSSIASLKSLQELDLSRNLILGSIPNVLQNISFLRYFNVSFNMLDGEVPTEGVFQNESGLVLTGNSKLCGGISKLHLPPCSIKGKKNTKHHKFNLMAMIFSVVSFLVIFSIILIVFWMRKRSKKQYLDSPIIDQLPKISYQRLYNGTNGFSSTNLIGCGNFSSVYKGTIELEEKVIAIKVINLQKNGAHKSFIAECNVLKNIKHRNLLQILTCCSSIDYKGQEFKAIIFEYMRNGSLEEWLHPNTSSEKHPRMLNLDQRLNIMIDVASALHYLHYECDQLLM